MSNLDLESVIEDSIADSNLSSEPEVVDTPSETPVEAAPEALEAPISEEVAQDPIEVASPAQRATETAQAGVQDEFGKKFGLQAESVPGRENRIPYSRVKKIVERAESEARKAAETPYVTKVQEFEAKIKEAEAYREKVTKFEEVMVNDVPRFVNMLKTLPQYQQYFAQLEKAQAQAAPVQEVQTQVNPEDQMPQPDQQMPDGTVMYSMEGLEKLNAWNRAQARKEALAEVEKTYGPIRQEWQSQKEAEEHIKQMAPIVRDQMAKARQWKHFTENEPEIVRALQRDRSISLAEAYSQVVFPKLEAEALKSQTNEQALKQKYRAEFLAELKRAPQASSAPVNVTRPSPTPQGNRSLEDIISEQVAAAGLK